MMNRRCATNLLLAAIFFGLVACGDSRRPPAQTDAVRDAAEELNRADTVTGTIKETTVSDDPIAIMRDFIAKQAINQSRSDWRTHVPKPPKLSFDDSTKYYWDLQTNKGPIRIRLMAEVAPMHVSSTIYLTELGFYDGLAFHRVIPGFMAQGGCPLGNGTGQPGYSYHGEVDPKVRHDRPGLLSMANTGRPGTDGSQFFITFAKTPHLDNQHTIFGEVVDGMDTVRQLEKYGTSPEGKPTTELKIEKAKITVE